MYFSGPYENASNGTSVILTLTLCRPATIMVNFLKKRFMQIIELPVEKAPPTFGCSVESNDGRFMILIMCNTLSQLVPPSTFTLDV